MKWWQKYRLRLERKGKLLRALRRGRRDLSKAAYRAGSAPGDAIFLFCVIRNEAERLPYFLEYYRKLGVSHFFFVDNGSEDTSAAILDKAKDVSYWQTDASYRRAGYGIDWLNYLLNRYGCGHWCLSVDIDEFFVYPNCDQRDLHALTDWLAGSNRQSFGAMLLDMYPKGPITQIDHKPGQNPIEITPYFDANNYSFERNARYGNLWIQGGPRQRVFFRDRPQYGPALNKIPLVRWARGYAYISSTHSALPRSLNQTYSTSSGQRASGVLLHTKFLPMFDEKSKEELLRGEHYARSREYEAYAKFDPDDLNFWEARSEKYGGWKQLEALGLISRGGWA